jgi:hypothetical protein
VALRPKLKAEAVSAPRHRSPSSVERISKSGRAIIAAHMDDLQDILRRLWVSDLQAGRELLEIQRDALMCEIISPLTSQDRRKEAFVLRDELMSQWAKVVEELNIYDRKSV